MIEKDPDKLNFNCPKLLKGLEKTIEYEFNNTDLLIQAMHHKSFVAEQIDVKLLDNERPEFIGDAVLGLVVSHILFEKYPNYNEGDLSEFRAKIVNDSNLEIVARSLNLEKYICLGKGEYQSKGWDKKSILANFLEAIIGAIYLDGGLNSASDFIKRLFSVQLYPPDSQLADHEYKSKIQELSQRKYKTTPKYELLRESGPDHNKTFKVQLRLNDICTEGIGKTKKEAQQDAARRALKILSKKDKV